MTQTIDTYGATVPTLPSVAAANKDVTSFISESRTPKGNHGDGETIAHFNIQSHLESGETELPIGIYDLGEVLPLNTYVSGPVILNVTETDAGAGKLQVLVEGGTAADADTEGKSNLTTNEFALGYDIAGKRLQAQVLTGTITAGAFTVHVPYRYTG